ncbi:MAG: hypothetical protein HYS27_14160 [Deltaproteobacteria bacterium]|nr:hypothetical protein [Deltaproteobacteria bacterium]
MSVQDSAASTSPTDAGARAGFRPPTAPDLVEERIATGLQATQVVGGVTRAVVTPSTVLVVTEHGCRIIVAVIAFSGAPR